MNNTPIVSKLLLTARETAEALAVSPRKLWAMTASGEIPHIRLGRSVRYPVEELKRWINGHKKGGEAR
jgi:excisionase family DNA binding protein